MICKLICTIHQTYNDIPTEKVDLMSKSEMISGDLIPTFSLFLSHINSHLSPGGQPPSPDPYAFAWQWHPWDVQRLNTGVSWMKSRFPIFKCILYIDKIYIIHIEIY